MIISDLQAIHKLVKKIDYQNETQITINLVSQSFDQKSFPNFLKRLSQIPSNIKFLEIIMQDNLYEDDYSPDDSDFSNLNLKQIKASGLKLFFENIYNGQSQNEINLLVKLGKDFLEDKYQNEDLSHVELIGQKGFEFILKGKQLILKYKEDLKEENLSIFKDINFMIQKWPKQFEFIDIKIIDTKNNVIKSERIQELMSFIPKYKEAQVIALEINANIDLNKQSVLDSLYQLKRKSLNSFSFIIKGNQSFNLLDQLTDLNTNLSFANFFYQQNNNKLEVKLINKSLEVTTNILILDNQKSLKYNFQSWRLERLQKLMIQNKGVQIYRTILQNDHFKQLKELTLDISPHLEIPKPLVNCSSSLGTLKKLDLSLAYFPNQKDQLSSLCDMIIHLKKLKKLSFKIQLENSHYQITEVISQKFQDLTKKIRDFNLVLEGNRLFNSLNNLNNDQILIQGFIPVLFQSSKIKSFIVQIQKFNYIFYNQQDCQIRLPRLNLSIDTFIEQLSYFSFDTLQNENIKNVDLDVTINDKVSGGNNIMRELMAHLKPTTEKLKISINTTYTDSFFDFDFELKNENLELIIHFNRNQILFFHQNFTIMQFLEKHIQLINQKANQFKNNQKQSKGQSNQNGQQQIISQSNQQINSKGRDEDSEMIIEEKKVDTSDEINYKNVYQKCYQFITNKKKECQITFECYNSQFTEYLLENIPQTNKIQILLKEGNETQTFEKCQNNEIKVQCLLSRFEFFNQLLQKFPQSQNIYFEIAEKQKKKQKFVLSENNKQEVCFYQNNFNLFKQLYQQYPQSQDIKFQWVDDSKQTQEFVVYENNKQKINFYKENFDFFYDLVQTFPKSQNIQITFIEDKIVKNIPYSYQSRRNRNNKQKPKEDEEERKVQEFFVNDQNEQKISFYFDQLDFFEDLLEKFTRSKNIEFKMFEKQKQDQRFKINSKNELFLSCYSEKFNFFLDFQKKFPESKMSKLEIIFNENKIDLKEIISEVQKQKAHEFIFNFSKCQMHNQESVDQLKQISKLKKNLKLISINLSETKIRQKGFQNLINRLSKFKKLKNLELDISNTKSPYSLNQKLILEVINLLLSKNMSNIINFTFKASTTHFMINSEISLYLEKLFQNAEPSLKKLHLDFSNNNISLADIKQLKFFRYFPESLDYFYLSLSSINQVQLPSLTKMVVDLSKFVQRTKINDLSILLPRNLQGTYTEDYFYLIQNLFLILLHNKCKNIQITTVNFTFCKKDNKLQDFSFQNLISRIDNITHDQKRNLVTQLCNFILNNLPIDFKITTQFEQMI